MRKKTAEPAQTPRADVAQNSAAVQSGTVGQNSVAAAQDGAMPEQVRISDLVPQPIRVRGYAAAERVASNVVAIISVGQDTRFLPRTLGSVLEQTVLPAAILIADCAGACESEAFSVQTLEGQWCAVEVVRTPGAASFGDSIRRVVESTAGRRYSSPSGLLWLLHDDSRPATRTTFASLLVAQRDAPSAWILGAKQVNWDDGSLQNVGYFVTRHWRRASLVAEGQEDQGQYDARQDVYGVSLAGALVVRHAWEKLKGTDSRYGTFGESMDFARRVHRKRGRVVVVPSAVMAHRRARYSGARSVKTGRAVKRPAYSYRAQIAARDLFVASQTRWWAAPFVWIGHLIASIFVFLGLLLTGKPVRAWWELLAPWRQLFTCGSALAARAALKGYPRQSKQSLSAVIATHRQMAESAAQARSLRAGRHAALDPLETTHLRMLARRRAAWVAALIVLGVVVSGAANWTLLKALFSGASLYSPVWAPTAARLPQAWRSATLFWSFSDGLGAAAAPLPFGLILVVISLLGAGNLAIGVTVFYLIAAALAMASFWCLAGIATRSNILRFCAALLWGALPLAQGIYRLADMPMLVVEVFLPLALFFLFRALGIYAVDEPHQAHPSWSAAVLSGLAAMLVILSEPQTLLAFLVLFIIAVAFASGNRLKMLVIPVPALVALAPTLWSAASGVRTGAWRQIFADALIPSQTVQGSPSNSGFIGTMRMLLPAWIPVSSDSSLQAGLAWAIVTAAAAIGVAAVAALCVPSSLRLSRYAWCVVLSGAALSLLAPRVAVGMDAGSVVAATNLPALAFIASGVLLAACAAAGVHNRPFDVTGRYDSTGRLSGAGHVVRVIVRVAASVVSAALACSIGTLALANWSTTTQLHAARTTIPLVAASDLAANPAMRVLALSATSTQQVSYSLMRTGVGDVISRNADTQVRQLNGLSKQERELGDIAAQLLASDSDSAVKQAAQLGIAGIYVAPSSSDARANLVAHILASAGTTEVVNNKSGLYVRLTGDSSARPGVSLAGESAAESSVARKVWIGSLAAVLAIYIILAFSLRAVDNRHNRRRDDSNTASGSGFDAGVGYVPPASGSFDSGMESAVDAAAVINGRNPDVAAPYVQQPINNDFVHENLAASARGQQAAPLSLSGLLDTSSGPAESVEPADSAGPVGLAESAVDAKPAGGTTREEEVEE